MREKSIDLMKGVAIIAIVITHYSQMFTLPIPITAVARFGQMATQLFFVMSAYTLSISYSKKKISYIEYIVRRLKGIMVGYWIAIGGYYLINKLICYLRPNMVISDTNILDLMINVLGLHGFFPGDVNNGVVRGGWFIGTLVIFYIIFPLLFRVIQKAYNRKMTKILGGYTAHTAFRSICLTSFGN